MALLSRSWYAPGGGLLSAPLYTADSPQILSVGGDNAVTQYERNVVISLLGFGEAIASVTFGGVECQIVSQVLGSRVVVNMPGHLATGLYEVSVSGAIESATISGISYTQTHPFGVPAGITVGGSGADSNSIWQGQGWMPADQPVYWAGPALPAGWSFIAPVTSWANAPTLQDIRDYIQAPAGYEGAVTLALSRLYADGTVVTWDADVTVSDDSVEPEQPTVTINSYTGTDATPTLTGTVSAGATVTVSINGQPYTAVVSGANWTANVTDVLPVGSYTATVTATVNGLTSTKDTTVTIRAADAVPVVTISPLVTTSTTPLLTGAVDDSSAEVLVTINGATYAGVVAGANWSAQVTAALPVGLYTAQVTATNAAGSSSAQANIRIQAVPEPGAGAATLHNVRLSVGLNRFVLSL